MKQTIPITLCTFVTLLASGTAFAQEGPQVAVADGEDFSLPDLPEVAARQQRGVERAVRRTEQVLGCYYMDGGDREGEGYEDDRCYDWFESLENAGTAGVHGIGRALLAASDGEESFGTEENRLIGLLGASRREIAVPYLIHILARGTEGNAHRANRALEVLTHMNIVHHADYLPPMNLGEDGDRQTVVNGWASWHAQNAELRVRDWRAAAVARAREQLSADDIAQRMWAIEHLVENGGARDAVESLREVIRSPETSAEARQYASRYARRRGLIQRREVRALVRESQEPSNNA